MDHKVQPQSYLSLYRQVFFAPSQRSVASQGGGRMMGGDTMTMARRHHSRHKRDHLINSSIMSLFFDLSRESTLGIHHPHFHSLFTISILFIQFWGVVQNPLSLSTCACVCKSMRVRKRNALCFKQMLLLSYHYIYLVKCAVRTYSSESSSSSSSSPPL